MSRNKRGAARKFFIFNFLLSSDFYHGFFITILNVTVADRNQSMHICLKKNSLVELQSSKTFFAWLSSKFPIFFCEMSVIFDTGHNILCLET